MGNKEKALLDGDQLNKKLSEITNVVLEVLGRYKDSTLVIRDKVSFLDYISRCVSIGGIAIDTETDNSTDPSTCKLMGLCIYSPGLKQAYVPVNHRDPGTKVKLADQITESDIKEALQIVKDNKLCVLMHNAKFDFEVLKCTCKIEIKANWDTMIAAKLLNENEPVGLKWQYTNKVDKTQQEYKIDKLFDQVAYADVNPGIFALYSATDAFLTYKLYEYQKPLMELKDNERIYRLFSEVEMPIVYITAEMELRGICVDKAFCEKLFDKYNKRLEDTETNIKRTINKLQPMIDLWKETEKAEHRVRVYEKDNEGISLTEKIEKYPSIDPVLGKRYRLGKMLKEYIKDEINFSSPAQLAVLIYDVFGVYSQKGREPRGTGAPELEAIINDFIDFWAQFGFNIKRTVSIENDFEMQEDTDDEEENSEELLTEEDEIEADNEDSDEGQDDPDIDKIKIKRNGPCYDSVEVSQTIVNLCSLLIERSKIKKLISSYLVNIPVLYDYWNDGKIRFHLNTLGTRTGRYSSGGKINCLKDDNPIVMSGVNIQNIPAKNHEIRNIFLAKPGYRLVGGDFVQQEPKIAAFISQDSKMISAYEEGQDLYAVIAQGIYDNNYQDNLEFYPEGTLLIVNGQEVTAGNKTHLNPEGKKRRSQGKVMMLASMYGMGGTTAGHKMGKTAPEGVKLLEKFYESFHELKAAIDDSIRECKKIGYVEDILGRRRRLPNIQLPFYKIQYIDKPYINQNNPDSLISSYKDKLEALGEVSKSNNDLKELISEAKKENVLITLNDDKIKRAERQCFNAIIQSSAASLTKKTMVVIYRDPILRKLDAHLLIQVHDEVILECPEENAEEVEKRLAKIMCDSSSFVGINVLMKCDSVIEKRWGESAMAVDVKESFDSFCQSMAVPEAIERLLLEYPEFPPEKIKDLVEGRTEVIDF